MTLAIRISWAILALIHLLPALALFRPSLLTTLYAVDPQSPAYLLIWHRAALFAMALVICIWASFRPEVRQMASVAIAISMIGFLALYLLNGAPPALRVIAIADLIGLPFLFFVAWSAWRT